MFAQISNFIFFEDIKSTVTQEHNSIETVYYSFQNIISILLYSSQSPQLVVE